MTLVVAAFAVIMLPWWLYGMRSHGRFVPLNTSAGINLLIGSGPRASGQYQWSEIAPLFTEHLRGVDVTTPAGSDVAASIAVTHIKANPSSMVRLVPAKLATLFAIEGREHVWMYSASFFGPLDRTCLMAWFALIVVAFPGLLGSAVAGASMRNGVAVPVLVPCLWLILATIAVHMISFGDPRYHLPLVPAFAVLSTGLARSNPRILPRRLLVGAALMMILAGPWSRQVTAYWAALAAVMEPGAWHTPLPFIDLL